jgi:hypothetical protein
LRQRQLAIQSACFEVAAQLFDAGELDAVDAVARRRLWIYGRIERTLPGKRGCVHG